MPLNIPDKLPAVYSGNAELIYPVIKSLNNSNIPRRVSIPDSTAF